MLNNILKMKLSALLSFLLSIIACAIIRPVSTAGSVFIILVVFVASLIVLQVIVRVYRFATKAS